MGALEINQIPAAVLSRFGADRFVLMTTADLDGKVLGTRTFDPQQLEEVSGLESLSELRRHEGIYSFTISMIALDERSIEEATSGFDNQAQLRAELRALLERLRKVYVVYAVTHFNFRPMEELTVFIGGDCYRTGAEIKDLETVLSRIKILAQSMIRKAVMIFPDIPTLHGGKKGEWIILDAEGRKIEGLSEAAIVALGTLIIPQGIKFLNDYKEMTAKRRGVFASFPARNVIRPDTASPDVLSGPNWKTMCRVWDERGVDLSYITCLPESLHGPRVPSSYPTAYGVVATACKLVEYRFTDRALSEVRFLIEALGGVGQATVEGLLGKGASPQNITAFDKSAEVCRRVSEQFGVNTLNLSHDEFYQRLDSGAQYDVWVNNGEGDNTFPEHVEKLLASGVEVFCGAANNFLQQARKRESLQLIFDAGAWAWPDEAASGGGWTLAVIDVLTRSKGEKSDSQEARHQILETIISRNENLVDEVVGGLVTAGQAEGQNIWRKVAQIINERVDNTLKREYAPQEIARQADVTGWHLV